MLKIPLSHFPVFSIYVVPWYANKAIIISLIPPFYSKYFLQIPLFFPFLTISQKKIRRTSFMNIQNRCHCNLTTSFNWQLLLKLKHVIYPAVLKEVIKVNAGSPYGLFRRALNWRVVRPEWISLFESLKKKSNAFNVERIFKNLLRFACLKLNYLKLLLPFCFYFVWANFVIHE